MLCVTWIYMQLPYIISVYDNGLNIIISDAKDVKEAWSYLKTKFEIEDLGKTRLC